MIIDELFSILTPQPVEGRPIPKDWGAVTDRLGEPLPTDFMQFIDAYDSVEFNLHLVFLNPFSLNPHIKFFEGGFSYLAALRKIKNDFAQDVPYPLYYELGGLLPWGYSVDGDIYCWVTHGISGTWKVAVVCRDGTCEAFDMTMTQFLARVFLGKILSASIHEELARQIVFRRLSDDVAG